MRATKRQRQSELQNLIDHNPFLTDQDLAEKFTVSIQTIRLDRMELGIPELRERVKMVANDAYAKKRSMGDEELVGNLQECIPGETGVSSLDVTMEMVYDRTMTVRAEYIFAQANSLAAFLANSAETAATEITLRYLRPVYAGERLICTAAVKKKEGSRTQVAVTTLGTDWEVFTGLFVFDSGQKEDLG